MIIWQQMGFDLAAEKYTFDRLEYHFCADEMHFRGHGPLLHIEASQADSDGGAGHAREKSRTREQETTFK